MLLITYRQNRETKETAWHVGEKVPVQMLPHQITQIQVDGDEAAHIEDIMGGAINRPVQRYYGDLARTIYLNL